MFNFLSFDRFITPTIIHVVFALGLVIIALGTVIRVIYGISTNDIFDGVIMPLIAMCVLALLWRIYCEVILVFFDMRDKLATIAGRTTPP